MSLNRKARRQFESTSARRIKVIGAVTAGSVVATQAAFMSPASALTISTVTNCNDSGAGSLRDAITGANADSDLTRIVFDLDPSCSTITLQSELPQITEQIDIEGPGAANLTIDGNANDYNIIFYSVNAVSQMNISGLTLDGGGILQSSDWNSAVVKTVNINNVVIKGVDSSSSESVLILDGPTGSMMTVENSLFTENLSSGTNGPMDLLSVTHANALFKNNTVIDNSFSESMFYTYGGEVVLNSNTIVTNDSGTGDWGDTTFRRVSLFGNIISDLEAVGAQVCGEVIDLGANLFQESLDTTDCSASALPTGAQTDGSSAEVSVADLDMGSLDYNGGSTPNIPLGDNSVARDYYTMNSTGIDNNVAIPGTDQRGGLRPAGTGFDVGSYEADAEFSVDDKSSSGATCTEKKLGTIRFAPFSSKLSKKSKKLIRAYVAKIKDSGCTTIDLTAHTATTTGAAKSLKAKRISLSKARNAAVQKYLTKQLKKAGITVTFKKHAMGAKNPAKSNKTETGRAKNRRVVVVMKALGSTL